MSTESTPNAHDPLTTPIEPAAAEPTPAEPAPTEPTPAEPTSERPVPEQPTPNVAAEPQKLRPRSGPIVWGALILVFCAYVAARTVGFSVDTTVWVITSIIGIGALLLLVGIAVLIRSARDRR